MRKYIIIFLQFAVFFSCSIKEDNNTYHHSGNDTVLSKDSLKKISRRDSLKIQEPVGETKELETPIAEGSPKVTTLPFCSENYFINTGIKKLIKKSPKVYRLPHIKKWHYFISDSSEYFSECSDSGKVDTSVFNFKKYRYRLPDIYGLKPYIVCDTTYLNYGLGKSLYPFRCGEKYAGNHGFLILYDQMIQEAKIIPLHHPDPSMEGGDYRTFCIDQNFVIRLQDYRISYIKEETEVVPAFAYIIQILPSGNLEVKKTLRKN
ncbi:MAG: hypothetical protein K2X86_12435 [Cytophagaceae bacterium]|nr:hypothetical protein [Cytophagaceae bacterium]